MPDPEQGRKPEDKKQADGKRKEADAKNQKSGDKKDKHDGTPKTERRSQH